MGCPLALALASALVALSLPQLWRSFYSGVEISDQARVQQTARICSAMRFKVWTQESMRIALNNITAVLMSFKYIPI